MEVRVNEEVIVVNDSVVLTEVLRAVHVPPERRGIAVAVNEQVVRRAEWSSYTVSAGDRIEIIQATQGG